MGSPPESYLLFLIYHIQTFIQLLFLYLYYITMFIFLLQKPQSLRKQPFKMTEKKYWIISLLLSVLLAIIIVAILEG
jgi:hypothetical protein